MLSASKTTPYLSVNDLLVTLENMKPNKGRALVVAIAGFGGSGKSTLAQRLKAGVNNSEVVSIDDFIIGPKEQRSNDWATFDRVRFKKEILLKAKPGKVISYDQYQSGEWANNLPGKVRTINIQDYLFVEGCGIIHPDLNAYYNLKVWIDCSLEIATDRAKNRDRLEGNNNDKLWDEVWGPNDKDYFEKFKPKKVADKLVVI